MSYAAGECPDADFRRGGISRLMNFRIAQDEGNRLHLLMVESLQRR
jgi:hypothetical protein